MDSNGSTFTRSFDETLIRELPHLRIAPLREPVSSRILSVPLTLEPNASGVREPNSISKANNGSTTGAGATESTNTPTRPKKNEFFTDPLLEPPPRPILPAFVNLRALERFPYSSFDDDSLQSRKRRRVDMHADSFGEHLQLPIPQAQKEQRPPPFGPFAILNGLNEPPPNAALLPPIEAGSITQLLTKPSRDNFFVEPALLATNSVTDVRVVERREGRIEDILDSPIAEKLADVDQGDVDTGLLDTTRVEQLETEKVVVDTDETTQPAGGNDEPLSPKTRGRSRKNLRKWTDEETTSLLRGVIKCGIGNWTAILAQPELKFNKRSASNLKDRFRVCCPWAYQAADPNEATKQLHDTLTKALSRNDLEGADCSPGKVRIPPSRIANSESKPTAYPRSTLPGDSSKSLSFSSTKEPDQKPSKASTKSNPQSKTLPSLSSKSKSALASLGIPEPHFNVKSKRRSRRPFTAAEDEALLKGYAVHGFQWTLIQQDKRLNFSHRRATDLRDRFRTKFPHAYRDGGSVSGNTLQSQSKDVVLKDGTNRLARSKRNMQELKRMSSDGISSANDPDSTTPGPIDAAPSSPIPPQTSENTTGGPANAFPFPLDDATTNSTSVDASWAANTLPPLVWDDLP